MSTRAIRSRLELVITLDYEIHGNGEGDPRALMVEPTDRLLDLLDAHRARLTIMADTCEILRFRERRDEIGRDDWGYGAIERQLVDAVKRGHDVQLHVHPTYERARDAGGRWDLDYADYDLARLGYPRISTLVKRGKEFLEGLLRPVRPGYRCHAFRAANWSMSPAADTVRVLLENGFDIETSVFKWGTRDELVRFDYANAESEAVPWPLDAADVCRRDERSALFEFPIYSENRPIWAFLSANRIYRVVQGRLHPLPRRNEPAGSTAPVSRRSALGRLFARAGASAEMLFRKHSWKLDLNQCSGRQMIAALERARSRYALRGMHVPIVLIGHSKLFNRFNEGELRPFLEYVASRPEDYAFGTFDAFDLELYRRRVVAA